MWLPIFCLTNILIVIYFFRRNVKIKRNLEFEIQDLNEKINVLTDQNSKEFKNKDGLQKKISRYQGLKKIIEDINRNLSLEFIVDTLSDIAFTLITDNKGTCILYLVDKQSQSLSLFKTKKEDKKLIIKLKEGDMFDHWILKHASPLLIEDIHRDFRFDSDALKKQDSRPFSSLIGAPFISDHKFLGILRLDCPSPNFYTKGYFLERLKEECKRSIRQNRSLALFMLDIDYFKNYNDKFGHTAGDIVLKTLSESIASGLKDLSPITSRFGGEEFCVILSGMDKKKAISAAERLRQKIEKREIILRRQETGVTVSIGVAVFPDDAKDEDELILRADRAMYEAKQKGRNRVCGI